MSLEPCSYSETGDAKYYSDHAKSRSKPIIVNACFDSTLKLNVTNEIENVTSIRRNINDKESEGENNDTDSYSSFGSEGSTTVACLSEITMGANTGAY